MNKKTTFTSVAQMVRETIDDDAFTDAVEERLRSRRIVKDLMVLRASRGLSQGDVASKMGCTQSRISKLESSTDSDLRLGDLARYASAVGFRVGIALEPRETTAVARAKKLALQIRDELHRLAGLGRDDQKVARGVVSFFNEAFFNLVEMLEESAEKRPRDHELGEPPIAFEILEGEAGVGAGPSVSTTRETRRSSDQGQHKVRRRIIPPARGDGGL